MQHSFRLVHEMYTSNEKAGKKTRQTSFHKYIILQVTTFSVALVFIFLSIIQYPARRP